MSRVVDLLDPARHQLYKMDVSDARRPVLAGVNTIAPGPILAPPDVSEAERLEVAAATAPAAVTGEPPRS